MQETKAIAPSTLPTIPPAFELYSAPLATYGSPVDDFCEESDIVLLVSSTLRVKG